jgi:Ca-activated chloride channel family protein
VADTENKIELSTAINLLPAEWVQKKVHYWKLKPLDAKDKNDFIARFAYFGPQLVPAGKYRLIYDQNEHQTSDSDLGVIEITAGKMNEIPLNTGVNLIPSDGADKPYEVEFHELDSSGKEIREVSIGKRFGPQVLAPGTYRINYHQNEHQSSKMTIVDSFDLLEGNLVEIEL